MSKWSLFFAALLLRHPARLLFGPAFGLLRRPAFRLCPLSGLFLGAALLLGQPAGLLCGLALDLLRRAAYDLLS